VRFLVGLLRVLSSLALTFIGLTAITFLIGRVMPLDPVLAIVGDRARSADLRSIPALHGRRPEWRLRHLDPDRAAGDRRRDAFLPGHLGACPMGVLAAVKRGQLVDHAVRVLGLIGYSMPVFWLGMVALLVFYARLRWVPGPGRLDVFYEGLVPHVTGLLLVDSALAGDWTVFKNAVAHLVLPTAILGTFALAYIARMTRSFMLDQLSQEPVGDRGHLAPCLRQRAGPAHHHHRPHLCLAA
jgi:peptide/nickel transport system permease protein